MSESGRVLYASIYKRESSYPVFAVPVCSVRCIRSGPKQEPSHQAKTVGTDGRKRIMAVATTSFKDKLPEAFASSFVLFSGVRHSPSRADGPPQLEEERGRTLGGSFRIQPFPPKPGSFGLQGWSLVFVRDSSGCLVSFVVLWL